MNKVWLVGDIHGDSNIIKKWYNENDVKGDTLICLGDFGMNYFFNYRDIKSKKILNKLDINIIALRGNHEERPSNCYSRQHDNWKVIEEMGEVKGLLWIEKGFPNIGYMWDSPVIYSIQEKQTLILPGAYSLDKNYRLAKNWSWFPQEQLDWYERAVSLEMYGNSKNDFILSHTCPLSWEFYFKDLYLDSLDQSKIDKTMETWMDTMINSGLQYNHWYFGHFHDNRDLPAVNATMLFQQFIPFGESLHSYQASCLKNIE